VFHFNPLNMVIIIANKYKKSKENINMPASYLPEGYQSPNYPNSTQGSTNDVEAAKFANGGIFSGTPAGTSEVSGGTTQVPPQTTSLDDSKKAIISANPTSDPAQARLINAGMTSGGDINAGKTNISTNNINFVSGSGTVGNDWRVRVSISPNAQILYNSGNAGIMSPLKSTNGVIFPYVPSVTVSYGARYGSQQLTHSNYTNYFYEGSEVQAINITADFSVQNTVEAAYFLATQYFFRAATKMFYGDSGQYQGSPPPIVYLDGYGAHYLPHVSCVITQFSHTMPADVDYIETTANGQLNRIPTTSQFVVTLQPVISRTKQRQFNYDSYARGDLINLGYL
jgi:hypothetical protein